MDYRLSITLSIAEGQKLLRDLTMLLTSKTNTCEAIIHNARKPIIKCQFCDTIEVSAFILGGGVGAKGSRSPDTASFN